MSGQSLLEDPFVKQAVSKISERSEKQTEVDKIRASFVDTGVIGQLDNKNSQILFGRRGTGKTHALKYLEESLKRDGQGCVVYIDCRTLGSTAQFSDESIALPRRCLMLFKDMLEPIFSELYSWIISSFTEAEGAYQFLEYISKLEQVMVALSTSQRKETIELARQSDSKNESGATISLSESPSIALKNSRVSSESTTSKESYQVTHEEKIHFPDLHSHLSSLLADTGSQLVVLIDEWASIPIDLQPFLAEFLRRGLLPVTRCTLKIASLEHRSSFRTRLGDKDIGLEVGADISAALDLDDYYVIDRNPSQVLAFYADILYRHLQVYLPSDHLRDKYSISSPVDFVSACFSSDDSFKEISRAAEGVVRDLINIFKLAFFNSAKRSRPKIDKAAIRNEAREWYEKDKSADLDDKMEKVLGRIIHDVIGSRQARAFLASRAVQKHPLLQRLCDARVLHLVQRGYADKDNPGVRYNIYCIDYGAYVDLIGTKSQPQLDLLLEGDAGMSSDSHVVPLDDKRSIRRIILPEEMLN
jgi:hypothetical protein